MKKKKSSGKPTGVVGGGFSETEEASKVHFTRSLAGRARTFGAFVVACLVFLLRIDREEKIMLELFPGEYPAYQKRTKKLIPLVW